MVLKRQKNTSNYSKVEKATNKGEMFRTTLEIPLADYLKFKAKCVYQGVTMSEKIRQFIKVF